jgi:hypothetical protein
MLMAGLFLGPPARALVSLNDGADHLYLTATASVGYDSNIFANAAAGGDSVYSAGLLLEYTRRAGFIGINASVALNASRFGTNTGENFNSPKFAVEFLKSAGRTTGSLALGAARESNADVVANTRVQSWNYDAALKFKYPVITRYSFSGNLGFTDCIYDQTEGLSNLRTYTVGADLLYAIESERDLLAGYSVRHSTTSSGTSFDDRSVTAGVTGRIFPKLNGSVRAGYEVRSPTGSTQEGGFTGLTASATLAWTLNKKTSLSAEVSRDVSVSATDLSVSATSASLTAQHAVNGKFSLFGSLGAGQNRFLGRQAAGRDDHYFTWGTGLNYTINEHLQSSLAYAYYDSRSTVTAANFVRRTVTLSLSSRW